MKISLDTDAEVVAHHLKPDRPEYQAVARAAITIVDVKRVAGVPAVVVGRRKQHYPTHFATGCFHRSIILEDLAAIDALVGEKDKAIELLDKVGIDPKWAPLRGNLQFRN